jgi:hypothetical protein
LTPIHSDKLAPTLISGSEPVWRSDFAAALAQTSQLLADGHRALIYESTFQHDGILIQAELLP